MGKPRPGKGEGRRARSSSEEEVRCFGVTCPRLASFSGFIAFLLLFLSQEKGPVQQNIKSYFGKVCKPKQA